MGTDFAPSDRASPATRLLNACPFLEQYRTEFWECGDTIVFGDVAPLLQNEALPDNEAVCVFSFFNELAETSEPDALDVLATGALETFNDNANSQKLARHYLKGRALKLLEQMRDYWGQPDYDQEQRR
jgi:hypothetical protein